MFLMTVLARSKAWICGRSPAEITGSNSVGGMDSVFCDCCVLSARCLCDGPFPIPGNRVHVCVCVCVCDKMQHSPLHLQ